MTQKPNMVFVHGIANGREEREAILPLLDKYLGEHFQEIRVAQWRSLGDFGEDLIDLRIHEVRRDEAVADVADVIAEVIGSGPTLVIGHSMGQVLAMMALRDLHLSGVTDQDDKVSLVTLGGPLGNLLNRDLYFRWFPGALLTTDACEEMGVIEWLDLHDNADPICGAAAYHAPAGCHDIGGGGPLMNPMDPFARHHLTSYLDSAAVRAHIIGMAAARSLVGE